MLHLLIDTSVWLDLAKDHKKESLLSVVIAMIEKKELTLILPQIVVEEFHRNKTHVAKDGLKSMTSALKRASDAIHLVGDPKKKGVVYRQLNDAGLKISQMGDKALESINQVGELFAKAKVIQTSPRALINAGQRGIDKKAPFHRAKNSMNDAVLIETYREYIEKSGKPGDRFAFVTHNKNDFSNPVDERLPHPDISDLFSRIKSLYSINLGETLHRIKPELVTDLMMDAEFEFIPRTLGEILKAEEELELKIWYNRHHNWLHEIETGKHKIVEKSEYKGDHKTTPRDIYERARKSAKEVEKKLGKDGVGPWDDFEWGMLNGKLSALRWVIGEDWDSLYT
jgi:hypothetical protein